MKTLDHTTEEKTIVYHDDLYVWQVDFKKSNVLNSLYSKMIKEYNELKYTHDKAGMLEAMKSVKHPQYKQLQKEFDNTHTFRILEKQGLL